MEQCLRVNNITKKFGGMLALKDVSFQTETGEILGLIGPNGAGKTTLFNIISGVLRQTEGEILFHGKSVSHMAPHKICKLGIARTFQIVKPFYSMTLRDNVAVGVMAVGHSKNKALEKADEVLSFLGLDQKSDKFPGELTLAEKKRLELSRALATDPKLLILDEVMAGLNTREMLDFTEIIKTIRQRDITIIMVEHVMQAILTLCHRVVVLNFGEILAIGTPEEVINDPKVIEAYLGDGYNAQN
ncbi:MAG: ABC transporter ATP-binding protein [Clostridiales Family XIII bacterium]|nr:ABC transporter ATP-binding protein [Clostridiales Family XIII bacterium]